MQNVTEYEQKTCIFKMLDDFEHDLAAATHNAVKTNCDLEGISFESKLNEDADIDHAWILQKLSEFYDVHITSIHIDDCDMIGVWICYKKEDTDATIDAAKLTAMYKIESKLQRAIGAYGADHVDMSIDSETKELVIMYHSGCDSFQIGKNICMVDDIELTEVERLCDQYDVGHCW